MGNKGYFGFKFSNFVVESCRFRSKPLNSTLPHCVVFHLELDRCNDITLWCTTVGVGGRGTR